MMGLMISAPASAASASLSADQSPHSASLVTTSRITLLSTSVAATLPPRELHDLVGGDAARASSAHVIDECAAARKSPGGGGLFHPDGVAIDLELDLGVREQSELLPDLHGNGDLP